MYENWLKHAHPGLPRAATWVLAWLLLPVILPVAALVHLAAYGLGDIGLVLSGTAQQLTWLWDQRTTFELDPWEQAR
jgi:hypothetical protein